MKKFSIIFSGQGFYNPNILKKLIKKNSIIKETFHEASDLLQYDILKKIFNNNYQSKKNQLDLQYFIVISSVAIFRMWLKKSSYLFPNFMAGHSIGQYSALICNNSITFKDGLKIIKIRNKIIKSNIKKISFLTYVIIGLELIVIKKICLYISKNKTKIFVSCINSNTQTVVTGHSQAVLKANHIFKKYGATHIIKLPIYFSMHCMLMKKISKVFSHKLKKINIKKGNCSIIENVNASLLLSPRSIYSAIVKQFYRPVKWNKIIEKLIANKIKYCVEINLNNSLRNLNFQYRRKIKILSIQSRSQIISTINIIKNNEKKK